MDRCRVCRQRAGRHTDRRPAFRAAQTALLALGACIGIAGILPNAQTALTVCAGRIGDRRAAFSSSPFLVARMVCRTAAEHSRRDRRVLRSVRLHSVLFRPDAHRYAYMVQKHSTGQTLCRIHAAGSGKTASFCNGILQILPSIRCSRSGRAMCFWAAIFHSRSAECAGLWLLLVVRLSRYMIRAAGAARILAAGLGEKFAVNAQPASCVLRPGAMIILGVWRHRSRVKNS